MASVQQPLAFCWASRCFSIDFRGLAAARGDICEKLLPLEGEHARRFSGRYRFATVKGPRRSRVQRLAARKRLTTLSRGKMRQDVLLARGAALAQVRLLHESRRCA